MTSVTLTARLDLPTRAGGTISKTNAEQIPGLAAVLPDAEFVVVCAPHGLTRYHHTVIPWVAAAVARYTVVDVQMSGPAANQFTKELVAALAA